MLSHMQAKGLSAGYNGEAVFRGLDLKIPEGSITTLIGSNGSGKSTFAKLMNGILLPSDGTVYISDMKTSDEKHLWDVRCCPEACAAAAGSASPCRHHSRRPCGIRAFSL